MSNNDERTLYLIRHAKSSHDNPELDDFDRPLAERGLNDGPLMGKRLQKLGVKPDLIVSSPSRRTIQTMELICKEIDYDTSLIRWDQSIYLSSLENMISKIRAVDDQHKTVFFCGHNPSMTETANFLQKDSLIENVVTTGIVAIKFRCSWSEIKEGSGQFLFFDYPKKTP